jgi:hypothetical protein
MLKEDRDLSVEFENGDYYFGEHIDSVPHGTCHYIIMGSLL